NYYGWARLHVDCDFTVFDYAINTLPDQPILTGEVPCTNAHGSIAAYKESLSNAPYTLQVDSDYTFCSGNVMVLMPGYPPGYNAEWLQDNTPTGIVNLPLTVTAPAEYSLKIDNAAGCADTSESVTISMLASLQDPVIN